MKSNVKAQQAQLLVDAEFASESLAVLDALPFYVILLDGGHHILYANKAVRQYLHMEPEQIVGGYCPEVVHGLAHPFPGCPLEEAIAKGRLVERELFDPASGRWVLSAIYPTTLRTRDGGSVFLHMVQDITGKKQAEEEIRRNYDIQTVLNALLSISLLNISLEEQLQLILDHVVSIPWLTLQRKGNIFLVEEANGSEVLVLKVHHELPSPLLNMCARVTMGRCLCGRAARSGEIQFADHVDERHENLYDGISPHGHYCIPVLSDGKAVGVINLYVREGHRRDEKEEDFLRAIANVVSGIIERKLVEEKLQNALNKVRESVEQTIKLVSSLVDARDPYTAGHQQRVAELACAMAQEMGLSAEQIEVIRIAGLIHDLGKIFVPAEILSKPGRLTEIEFSLVKMHAQVGYELLKTVELPPMVAQIVLHHHERMDGSGYPSGLTGEAIPLEARILAVADVVEAISSHRPYRPALGIDKALEEISQKRGILYDYKVVDACLKHFEKGFKIGEAG